MLPADTIFQEDIAEASKAKLSDRQREYSNLLIFVR